MILRRVSLLLILTAWACAAPEAEAPHSESAAVRHIDGWDGDEAMDVYFIPGGTAAEDRLASLVSSAQTEIRVAMYNLRSDRLGWLLLDRQRAGVHVEVLWDAKQMAKDYNTLDDELIAEGLNVVPIHNTRSKYATLHDKLAVIDGHTVTMGSPNWGNSALHQNDESMLVVTSASLAATVDAELDEIASGVKTPRKGDTDSRVQMHFSPEDRLDLVTERAIDAATDRIYVAMFSVRWHSLAEALVRAHNRGVKVFVVTDEKQAATSVEDEFLADAGVPVAVALNATTPYTAMHHKFLVIDGKTTLVGSYNWSYTATFGSYEDLAVIADDAEVASAFEAEVGRLWRVYGDGAGPATNTVTVQVRAHCRDTSWGDQLVLVGNIDELGAWDPHQGVRLDGATWPTWSADLTLPAGAQLRYKLVVLRADGSVWWDAGADHELGLPTADDDTPVVIDDAFRP